MKFTLIRNMLLVIACVVGAENASAQGLLDLMRMGVDVGRGVASQSAGRMTPSTDADMATVQLATPTTNEIFIETAKTVAVNLGYQLSTVQMRIVAATRQDMETGFVPFRGLNTMKSMRVAVVTIQLGPDDSTIQISVHTSGNGTSAAVAKEVADVFKKGLLDLYADKS